MATPEMLFSSALVLEDDPAHLSLVRRAIKPLVGSVTEVATAAQAYEALRQSEVQLIVADLHLPDTRGVVHVGTLHQIAPRAPILVLTSSTSLEEAVEAMKLGASEFLVKNFDSNFSQIFALALARLHTAHKLVRERERLQSEMAALRMAIENGSDGLAVLNRAGQVLYCNSGFLDVIAKCGGGSGDITTFFSPAVARYQELLAAIEEKRRALPSGAVWQTEVTFTADRSLAFTFSLSILDQHSRDDAAHAVVWAKNVSEQRRREQFQREILSTTTHDLKGPLGAILISSELAGELIAENKKASELVVRIASSAQNALNLIDEFLSARRIEEGSFILRPKPQEVSEIVREAVEPFTSVAVARKVSLTLTVPDGVTGCCDKLGLMRVLGNLVSNALKFTAAGGQVEVRLSGREGELILSVADSGTGMEPGEVSRLFERFSRLERHREYAGTGLGLYVVQSIVTAHGGKIEVTSKVGEGTTFEITLPSEPPVNSKGELVCLSFA